ncbi:MAG TPA: hypothetical protein VFB14_03675 [Bryobacteraceae bacterium]|jgi:hypothetical protein|nr:hypothetical protein [Bryobacteraceae bacterium]
MLRILFDKNVPYPLKRYLANCQVKMAEDEGWDRISNGELIACAEEAGYHILLTCDQNLSYQQNLTHRRISLVVLGSNIWPGVELRIEEITAELERAVPGSFEFVEIPHLPKRRRVGSSDSRA